MIRELDAGGSVQVHQRGGHRQIRRATQRGAVTVPGALGEDLHAELIRSTVRRAGIERGSDDRERRCT
ncbi:MAG: type II toxin-antitoxin system HicA family toxin [Acidimicrobiales bacterium]